MKRVSVVILVFHCLIAFGQEQPKENTLGDAAANATNPLAFVTKFQIQPNYTIKNESAIQFNLTARIAQPSASIGLPFIKSKDPSKIYSIYRFELPIIGQTYPMSSNLDATGLSDLVIIDIIAFKKDWGILGVGPGLIVPTASENVIGSGKWSAGVTGLYLNTKTKGLQFGVLAQQFNSFAGESGRATKNFMLFQPIFNKILSKGYFLQIAPIFTFDWENDNYNFPLTIAIGKAFAKNLTMNIGPEYVISGPNKGDFTIRLNLNTMFAPAEGK